MKKYIKGIFKRSIYESEKGYIIGLFKIKDTTDEELNSYINKSITFTGYFTDLNPEDMYIFYGEVVDHPKYGFQYQVSEFERVKPEDREGIIEFLCSDLFPKIGEKMAEKIVDTLGDDALEKIINEPSCLNLVPKLSSKKAKMIYDVLTKYEESHKTIVYLTELGFPIKDALDIYNKYKNNTILNIEHNIFKVLDDLDISFLKVDEISRRIDIPLDDERRIKACIFYVIKKISFSTGNTSHSYDEIKTSTFDYLKFTIPDELFKNYLDLLRLEAKIVLENEDYYLKDIYDAEENIVDKITYLANKPKDNYKNVDKYLSELEEEFQISYNDKQKEAIKKAIENNIVIITGGPGTGKTTIIKAIVSMYAKINKLKDEALISRLALLAPTGRASKRMSESTLLPATTIHRFLKWNKETNEFAVNDFNKDFSELILVDEVSMIDINLMSSLLKGLTNSIKLVLVGDYNQLPSVGPGQILKDMLDSKVIESVSLDYLYRQSEDSYIPTLAKEIKDDEVSDTYLETKNDYTFLKCSNDSIKSNLYNLCEQIKEKGYDLKRLQIMAPMYRGENGIDNLNKELQKVFNPSDQFKNEIVYGDVIYRENDKILQLVNMPEENVFNGDIGFIKYIIPSDRSKSKKNEIYVDYDGLEVKYLPNDFVKIKHGFIISIHKSQGSEFEMVILPISTSYNRMFYRKLIYTAVTRAKKKLILIGEPNAFLKGVHTNYDYLRKTNMSDKLKNKMYNNPNKE